MTAKHVIDFLKRAQAAGYEDPRLLFAIDNGTRALELAFHGRRDGTMFNLSQRLPLITIELAEFRVVEVTLRQMAEQLFDGPAPGGGV